MRRPPTCGGHQAAAWALSQPVGTARSSMPHRLASPGTPIYDLHPRFTTLREQCRIHNSARTMPKCIRKLSCSPHSAHIHHTIPAPQSLQAKLKHPAKPTMFNKKITTTAKNSTDSSGTKASRPSSSSSSGWCGSGCGCGSGSGGQNINYEPPLSLKKHGFSVPVFKPKEH